MGRFDSAGLGLAAGALAALVIEATVDIPFGSTADIGFAALVALVLGIVLAQLQTLATPTTGRVLMTGGIVVGGATLAGYLPSMGIVIAAALVVVGGWKRAGEAAAGVGR